MGVVPIVRVRDTVAGDGLREPAWHLSYCELRAELIIIEHDDIATVPGDLSESLRSLTR